jgi:hypothetical protein
MESKGLIVKDHISIGKRGITTYKPTEKGIDFCKSNLEPYEIMFPRTDIGIKENIAVLLVLV